MADRCGAGDVLMALGFVLGYRQEGTKSWISTTREDHRQLLSIFREEPHPDREGAWELGARNPLYQRYIESDQQLTYSQVMQRDYPGSPRWLMPDHQVPDEDLRWADSVWSSVKGDPERRIVVNPWAAWASRNWAEHGYWDLMWELHAKGWQVLLMGRGEMDSKGAPYCVWGTTWPLAAALFKTAKLVVGNDSGPAHVAGCMGVPALALCGPTTGMFDRYPSVLELSLDGACSGCWFRRERGFRSSCDRGCRMLGQLPVESVLEVIKHVFEADGSFRPDRVHQSGQKARPMAGLPAEVVPVPTVRGEVLGLRWMGALRRGGDPEG